MPRIEARTVPCCELPAWMCLPWFCCSDCCDLKPQMLTVCLALHLIPAWPPRAFLGGGRRYRGGEGQKLCFGKVCCLLEPTSGLMLSSFNGCIFYLSKTTFFLILLFNVF